MKASSIVNGFRCFSKTPLLISRRGSCCRLASIGFYQWSSRNGVNSTSLDIDLICVVILCVVISALNFHEGFTSGYIYVDNETQLEIVECYATGPTFSYDWYGFVENVNLIFLGKNRIFNCFHYY